MNKKIKQQYEASGRTVELFVEDDKGVARLNYIYPEEVREEVYIEDFRFASIRTHRSEQAAMKAYKNLCKRLNLPKDTDYYWRLPEYAIHAVNP